MVDFQKAFLKGIEAHDEATRARREISSVFDDFAHQILLASNAKIQVRRDASQRRATADATSSAGAEAVSYGTLFAGAPYAERYELCSYQLSRLGYPVTLTFGSNDHRCEDKASLERCLIELLQDPLTGGKLRRLMGTESPGGETPVPPEAAPDDQVT